MSSNTQTELDKALSQAGYTGGVDETVTHAPLYSRTVRSRDISKRTGRWECPLFYDAHDAGRLDPTPADVAFATSNLNDPRPVEWFREMHEDLDAAEQDLCDSIRTTMLYGKQLLNTGTVSHYPIEENVKYIRKQRALLDRAFQIDSELELQVAPAIEPSELEQKLQASIDEGNAARQAREPQQEATVVTQVTAVLGDGEPYQIVTRGPALESDVLDVEKELENSPNAATWIGDGPIEVPEEVIPVAAHERKKPTERKARAKNQTSPMEETGTLSTEGVLAKLESLHKEVERLTSENEGLKHHYTKVLAENDRLKNDVRTFDSTRGTQINAALEELRADYSKLENGMFAALAHINALGDVVEVTQQEVEVVERRGLAVMQSNRTQSEFEESKKTWPAPKRFLEAADKQEGFAELLANLQRLANR